jgi:hypothetical protein
MGLDNGYVHLCYAEAECNLELLNNKMLFIKKNWISFTSKEW